MFRVAVILLVVFSRSNICNEAAHVSEWLRRQNGERIAEVARSYLGSTLFRTGMEYVSNVLSEAGVHEQFPSTLEDWSNRDSEDEYQCWRYRTYDKPTLDAEIGDVITDGKRIGVIVGLYPRYAVNVVGQSVQNSVVLADEYDDILVWSYQCELTTT